MVAQSHRITLEELKDSQHLLVLSSFRLVSDLQLLCYSLRLPEMVR